MATRADSIRHALIYHIFSSAKSPVPHVAAEFGVTLQAVQQHLKELVSSKTVLMSGSRKHVVYQLAVQNRRRKTFALNANVSEDLVWSSFVSPLLGDLAEEEQAICNYGLTEIFNNAIDHSRASTSTVTCWRTAAAVVIEVSDNGHGIFRTIASALHLVDSRQAFLELSKGKFTTDPKRHTGEGIFFSSRLFDRFTIRSDAFEFRHSSTLDEWQSDDDCRHVSGTRVIMELLIPSKTFMRDVFSRFSSGPDDYRFAKTQIPVKLATFGDEPLMSRSSAKRVLSRIDRFDEVVLDFSEIRSIGQAFADEIFRVFASAHPKIDLVAINAGAQVTQMIRRAQAARDESEGS